MEKFSSPLRYPGSKIKLVQYIKKVLDYNKFQPKILVEPFVGGGSVSVNFLLNGWVDKIVIADKDRLIYSFWKVLFNNSSYLIKFIKKVDVNLENFYRYKKIAANKKINNDKKLAEACLFLNRTSFSGILRDNTGPIGGKNQNSEYKIDCRFNRDALIEKIKHLSEFSNKVSVLPYSWEKTIVYAEKIQKKKKNNTFLYLDPPFYKKANNLYRYYFTNDEHKKLKNSIKKLKGKLKNNWILSYDRAKEIREIYNNRKCFSIALPYSINSPAKRIEKEYFITPLRLPLKKDLEKD